MKLATWHRWSVYGAVAALTVTGGAWLVCHYLLASPGEYGRLPHPSEPLWRMLHGAAGMGGLFVFGSLLVPHMLRAWSLGRSRFSGAAQAGTFVVLALTGLALYYVGDDAWREAIGLAHWVLGLMLPVLLALHIWSGRSELRRATATER